MRKGNEQNKQVRLQKHQGCGEPRWNCLWTHPCAVQAMEVLALFEKPISHHPSCASWDRRKQISDSNDHTLLRMMFKAPQLPFHTFHFLTDWSSPASCSQKPCSLFSVVSWKWPNYRNAQFAPVRHFLWSSSSALCPPLSLFQGEGGAWGSCFYVAPGTKALAHTRIPMSASISVLLLMSWAGTSEIRKRMDFVVPLPNSCPQCLELKHHDSGAWQWWPLVVLSLAGISPPDQWQCSWSAGWISLSASSFMACSLEAHSQKWLDFHMKEKERAHFSFGPLNLVCETLLSPFLTNRRPI